MTTKSGVKKLILNLFMYLSIEISLKDSCEITPLLSELLGFIYFQVGNLKFSTNFNSFIHNI